MGNWLNLWLLYGVSTLKLQHRSVPESYLGCPAHCFAMSFSTSWSSLNSTQKTSPAHFLAQP